MEKTVDALESMFQKAETDLKYITRKLDFELMNEDGIKQENNPLRMLKAIEDIKSEYSNLVQDMAAIQTAQKDAVEFLRGQLLTMAQMLEKLEAQTGQNPELAEETLNQFMELSLLMGIPKDSLLPTTHKEPSISDNPEPEKTSCQHSETSSDPAPVTLKKATHGNGEKQKKEAENTTVSACDRRANNSTFIEIDHDEFMSVSELIRGRAKLDDVNKAYKILWDHFKEERNKEALTPKEMNSMGLRVTGATGEAKLKILRALKLCQISRTGDVTLT
ncbi:unnamed protein product [Lymnaea stagnalis]|uniref:Protein FAM33A n=1 Tax=Lymnaea stagnalis TaxID=6523 RepID=A0AAV2IIM5_LYMST